MRTLSIAPASDRLFADGKPFFYLADTCWSAFTNPTLDEWAYYLHYRANQGFNALQINIMPQGDRSENTWDNPMPFAREEGKAWDFSAPNPAYFDRCVTMLEMAAARGFTPALVLLWADLVPGTSINKTYHTRAMRLDEVETYVRLVVDRFARFNPIWIVSGDSDLPDEGRDWYRTARDLLKRLTPHLPCTFHMAPSTLLPEEWTDIYLTYSGHSIEHESGAYTQAMDRHSRRLRRPIINGEPCYEAHGSGPGYRFSAFDVRRVMWWSLLSGAKAGFTYGAHGIWSWHRTGRRFCNEAWAQTPLDWRAALTLPGAWDASRSASLFEQHGLIDCEPRQNLLLDMPEQVRLAANAGTTRFAAYVPYPRNLNLRLDLSGWRLHVYNLADRREEHPVVTVTPRRSTIAMVQANADVLVVGSKEEKHKPGNSKCERTAEGEG